MKRHAMGRSHSRRDFSQKSGVHPKNRVGTSMTAMRAGTRF